MKAIHIIAELLALIAGAVALYVVKDSKVHRKIGMIFAIAASRSYLHLFRQM